MSTDRSDAGDSSMQELDLQLFSAIVPYVEDIRRYVEDRPTDEHGDIEFPIPEPSTEEVRDALADLKKIVEFELRTPEKEYKFLQNYLTNRGATAIHHTIKTELIKHFFIVNSKFFWDSYNKRINYEAVAEKLLERIEERERISEELGSANRRGTPWEIIKMLILNCEALLPILEREIPSLCQKTSKAAAEQTIAFLILIGKYQLVFVLITCFRSPGRLSLKYFYEPETWDYIKQLLPQALRDPNEKVRTVVTNVILEMAKCESFREWPRLLDVLSEHLRTGQEYVVLSAMEVLPVFIRDLDEKLDESMWLILLEGISRILRDEFAIPTKLQAMKMCRLFIDKQYSKLSENTSFRMRNDLADGIVEILELVLGISRDGQNLLNNLEFRNEMDDWKLSLSKLAILPIEYIRRIIRENIVARFLSWYPRCTTMINVNISSATGRTFEVARRDDKIFVLCQEIFEKLILNLSESLDQMMSSSSNIADEARLVRTYIIPGIRSWLKYYTRPLNVDLFGKVFRASCNWILDSNDPLDLEEGIELIWTFLSASSNQVNEYIDMSNGKTGTQYIFEIMTHLGHLEPYLFLQLKSYNIRHACRTMELLIWVYMNTMQRENIILLLKDMLYIMYCIIEMPDKPFRDHMLNFLEVYADFINIDIEAVLEFLSTEPSPSGENHLVFVLGDGFCWNYEYFNRRNGRETVTRALKEILQHEDAGGDWLRSPSPRGRKIDSRVQGVLNQIRWIIAREEEFHERSVYSIS